MTGWFQLINPLSRTYRATAPKCPSPRPDKRLTRARKRRNELLHFFALRFLVGAANGVLHAVGDVIAKYFALDLLEGRDHSLNLIHDINAVAVSFDHADQAAHLAFDATEAVLTGFLGHSLHA